LVEVSGRTLLEITIQRLASFGVRDFIINVHHFADTVSDYLAQKRNFGFRIEISREDVLLDTGGGLKKASWFFLDGNVEDEFILHNVDVISTIDLSRMLQSHAENHALATLAVQDRDTSRYLLFDERSELCGRQAGRDGTADMVRPATKIQALAFSGVHVISPRLLPMISEEGVFSIITTYLRLAGQKEKIQAFGADEYYWRDLGKPESIVQVESDVAENRLQL